MDRPDRRGQARLKSPCMTFSAGAVVAYCPQSADLYQPVSYAQRYQCQRLALIYPAMKDVRPGLRDRLSIQGADAQRAVCSIDLAGVLSGYDAAFEGLRAGWLNAEVSGTR